MIDRIRIVWFYLMFGVCALLHAVLTVPMAVIWFVTGRDYFTPSSEWLTRQGNKYL